jgi:hypothetical protein
MLEQQESLNVDALQVGTIHMQTNSASSITPDSSLDEVEVASASTVLPSSDFISDYADYADVLEVPREMHGAVAIQLLASVLNGNGVTIPLGALCITLDLWQVLLSGSGAGRSTLVTQARPVLKAAKIEDTERDSTWGSPQALYQSFASHPTGLFVWGELSEKLKLLNEMRFAGAKQWITDRYDSLYPPAEITYRKTGQKNKDTQPIVFKKAPRINILATSSEEWFFQNLLQSDSAGGFVPRWLLIRPPDSAKDVAIPRTPDPMLVKHLGDHLRRASELRGEVDISNIHSDYEKWYSATKKRFKEQPNQALALAYFNRHRVHVLKLAAIYEVSASCTLKVSHASWRRAVNDLQRIETTLFSLLSTGMTREGHIANQITEKIREGGIEGATLTVITRAFQHLQPYERLQYLTNLVDARIVVPFVRSTGGRASTLLVHEDFLAEHKQKYPADKLLSQLPRPK